jgi:tetratricopeptide (TPR) repeat protein
MEKILKQDPSNENWKALLADAQVRLATIQSSLHTTGDSGALAKKGLASLKNLTKKEQVSPMTLDQAASAFLKVEPASLGDPQFAVSCAERAVALSHRKVPSMLLTLSQAYRAAGQTKKSRATAEEGLALLPVLQPGGVKPRIRKLLEIQMHTAR